MTALILATKSHFSFLGAQAGFFRHGVLGAGGYFNDAARERISLLFFCIIALLLCVYVVSVNVILGEGGNISTLERAIREESTAVLDIETIFSAQSSAEQLKKYDVVRRMEEIGGVEYVRLGGPSLVEVSHALP